MRASDSCVAIQHFDIDLVTEDLTNPRDHDQEHIDDVAVSISKLGLNGAAVADENLGALNRVPFAAVPQPTAACRKIKSSR